MDWETGQGHWRICDRNDQIQLGASPALEILNL